MIYLKSAVAGVLVALLALIVMVVLTTRVWVDVGEGSGGIGAVSAPFAVSLPVLMIAFAAGFIWRFRRLRRRA